MSHIEQDIKLNFDDVLLKPKRSTLSSRASVDLNRTITFRYSPKTFTGVPIMAANMDGVGTFSMAKVLQKYNCITVIKKHYTLDDWKEAIGNGVSLSHIAVCTGANMIHDPNAEDYDNIKKILEQWPDINYICIDVANGYQEAFSNFVARVRKEYPDKIIIAGNVITPEMTEQLIIRGADIVKCGIGPGSVCTTRAMTGVGYPQLSGILECADAAHGLKGHIVSDGGCRTPGDVSKAFAAGADFVMLGGMLAAHKESELQLKDGKYEFYGMASDRAMEEHGGRKDGYRGAEGKVVYLPDRGPVQHTINEILGGVRSSCTYVGAERLKDLPRCATFVQTREILNRVYSNFE
mgnify:CR=1 FL=1